MQELKLSLWIRDPEEEMFISHLIDKGEIDPEDIDLRDPYVGRIAVLIQLYGGDRFRVAFAIKSTQDQHNRVLENAILRYRINNRPLDETDFDLETIKEKLFCCVKKSLRNKLKIDEASRDALTNVFCEIAAYISNNTDYFQQDDYLYAIYEYNNDKKNRNRSKIHVPPYLKKKYRLLSKKNGEFFKKNKYPRVVS